MKKVAAAGSIFARAKKGSKGRVAAEHTRAREENVAREFNVHRPKQKGLPVFSIIFTSFTP